MSCIGGHHVTYVEDPQRVAPCACGASGHALRSVVAGRKPGVLWSVERMPLHLGRPRKVASQ